MVASAPLRVQGATAYPLSAASARVRVANYIPFLAKYGVELSYTPTLSLAEYALLASSATPVSKARVLGRSATRAARVRDDDVLLLVHRLLTLTPTPMVDPPRNLDVYDFDDALLVGSAANINQRFQWMKQEAKRARLCMSRARLVIAANSTLAAEARHLARRVEVIPSCVDPSGQPVHNHERRTGCVVGWIGSHTTLPYLHPLIPILQRLHSRGHRLTFVVVGGETGLREDWIEHRPWSMTTQPADLADFDIGVMPLPDTAWTRGKSGYKILQYFAAGVPAVASPVGLNADLLQDGRGIPATTDEEWERALLELISDVEARRERGRMARRFAEDHYSYQRWAPELASLLLSLN